MRDPYVAAMKGVIWSICPNASIVDLTHEIEPQDVLETAFFVAGAAPHFPGGTVHVVVVDPGVGSDRLPIAAAIAGQIIVCPDNGILTLLARRHRLDEVRVIANRAFMLESISNTFHARDIFAPAAAHVARAGRIPEEIGPPLNQAAFLPLPEPLMTAEGAVTGQVIHIDRFGNVITNIHCEFLGRRTVRRVAFQGTHVEGVCRTYSDVPDGQLLALFGSSGYLEIAVNKRNAAKETGLARGDRVDVRTASDRTD